MMFSPVGCLVLVISVFYDSSDLLIGAQEYAGERYDGHQLLRTFPRSLRDIRVLQSLKNNRNIQVDFWHGPGRPDPHVDVLLPPQHKGAVHSLLKGHSIEYEISHPNLQQAIDAQFTPSSSNQPDRFMGGLDLSSYHSFDQMVSWMLRLQEENSDHVTVLQVGSTVEGRPIYTVKLSFGQSPNKRSIWLDAGIHANEWVGPATMMYFIHQMLNDYGRDPEVTRLLDTFDWFITPVINADGYSYTWTKDRMWRKNRNKFLGTECIGVDLNRNWGVHWGEGATAATDPCDRMYIGPSAMSEPEVQSVASFLRRQNGTTVAYLAYHSFGQLWMIPYSYSQRATLPEQEELLNMSREAVDAIEKVHGTKYRVGRISDIVGEAAGASVDFTYQALNIKYSFGVELRDNGKHGTLLPPEQIIPNAEESFVGLKRLGQILLEKLN